MQNVQFRGRRMRLWPDAEAPLGEKVDPEVFLRREAEMRTNFTAPLSLSEPMKQGASDFDEPWQGPFYTPGLQRLGELWFHSDGSQMLLQVVRSKAHFVGDAPAPAQRRFLRLLGAVPEPKQRSITVEAPEFYRPHDRGPMTEDGHVYYACITSAVCKPGASWDEYGLVTVLFPHTGKDRQSLVRPMAMYAVGRADDNDCAEVISRLIQAFQADACIRKAA